MMDRWMDGSCQIFVSSGLVANKVIYSKCYENYKQANWVKICNTVYCSICTKNLINIKLRKLWKQVKTRSGHNSFRLQIIIFMVLGIYNFGGKAEAGLYAPTICNCNTDCLDKKCIFDPSVVLSKLARAQHIDLNLIYCVSLLEVHVLWLFVSQLRKTF